MSKYLRAAFTVAAVGMVAAASQAAPVAMYGEYHESNGIIVNIPQNPPIVPCVPPPVLVAPPVHQTVMGSTTLTNPANVPPSGIPAQHIDLRPTGVNDARCHDRENHVNFTTMKPGVFNQPDVGNHGARIVNNGGLNVGDAFTIPPFAFAQQLGPQVGIVLQNITRQLDSTFIAAMPGIDRIGPNPGPLPAGSYTIKTPAQMIPPPALTRHFSQGNWNHAGNGQNNGVPGAGFRARLAANTTHFNQAAGGNAKVQVRYRSGPRQFGGTMALLLDGKARLNLGGPLITGMMNAFTKPGAATQPVGDGDPGYRVRNAHGWDITAFGFQAPGRVKAFFAGANPNNAFTPMHTYMMTPNDPYAQYQRVAAVCTQTPLPLPAGCNELNGFDTFMASPFLLGIGIPAGGTVGQLPKATSYKHLFALTTGTVSVIRVSLRGGIHFSDTLTGMGYDTVGVSSMGGPQRNVGLVAGSYTIRTSFPPAGPDTQINAQLLGINLKFTPEPGATVALASGLGLLGLLAYRRRA